MSFDLPQICVVCFANYCRSPVAEQLLQKRFKGKLNVISATFASKPEMDQSKIFLKAELMMLKFTIQKRLLKKLLKNHLIHS